MTQSKPLPHSVEAEQGVLGSMLMDKNAISECAKITDAHFYIPAHQTIYRTLIELWEAQKDIDLITFTQVLRDQHTLDAVGGVSFVTSLFTIVPTSANLAYYLDIVRDKYLLREIINTSTEAVRRACQEQDDVNLLLADTTSKLSAITTPKESKKTFKELLLEKLDRMESGEPDADILKTGITKLDQHSPLKKGDMPLIVGERKDGKSILALTIISNLLTIGERVEYFSLESPESEIIDRLFAGNSRIPMDFHHVKKMNEGHMTRATNSINKMTDWKLVVHDDHYSLNSIRARIRQAKAIHPDLSVAVVDYAQLVTGATNKSGNREQEVASVSRGLRLIAIESKVALILLSQLNGDRQSRESRALENDTTACWEILRDEDEPNERKIVIPYQRNGESGISFDVAFLGNIARIENLSREEA